MALTNKKYSEDTSTYEQKSVSARIEALFLNNIGLVVTREQILGAARDPKTGKEPENWHQRLSELRTDKGYTILSWRDSKDLAPQEYLMPHTELRIGAGKRVLPTKECWAQVMTRAGNCCEWTEDGQRCGLAEKSTDPVGGGTVKLTPDHVTPHSINPNTDTTDPKQWQALCGRHQVMKKNYWDSGSGKINISGILQSIGKEQKEEALQFLLKYFGHDIKRN
ncbi:restriction endonuclease [Burkholderia stagnalis]|uniref:restriction endonuclease n=1 Tax=Burkholderia stagnalis TaxID=1503054 RepID=UPI0009BD8362|nr:restriction endonuclease [Burkholderia stagnalis]